MWSKQCYSLDLKGPLNTHILKALSPAHWEVAERLRGKA